MYTTVKVSRHYIALIAQSQTTILKLPELECVDVLQDVQSVECVAGCTVRDTLIYIQHNKVHLYHLHYRFHDAVMEINGQGAVGLLVALLNIVTN